MKILTVADTVTEKLLDRDNPPPELAGIEFIIGCGDLPPEYLTALRSIYNVPLYYVLGNHDIRYDAAPPVGCHAIHRRLVVHHGIRIAGFSGSRWYNGNVNQYTEKEMTRYIRRMWFKFWRTGVDLIVTHAPPRYIGDAEDPCHRGFHAYHKLLAKNKPRYMVHGHIHRIFQDDAERTSMFGTTQVINSYGYYTFEIEPV
ncbi:metallophosphoesterase family protein [Desulfopila aestuarii]|uniref:Predicted phosphoesterase n=1 Tax=Desulfopila aestuarii DSM 18488 TaxID=1121416 RepID=A0A1M7YD85_9BACT|nr:metallophosphoesterase [Desulfopila aestuarii]SHO50468.1 Predicted phosphoesterase [Desulfopila aestuarii DSM 18488]